mmetsp:Transcript_8163/g.14716  ORF Transcript_8163/g.14716 Transcript_8163/m.14716 type:complete len:200 (+) Transcript_8163:669-1268(+)
MAFAIAAFIISASRTCSSIATICRRVPTSWRSTAASAALAAASASLRIRVPASSSIVFSSPNLRNNCDDTAVVSESSDSAASTVFSPRSRNIIPPTSIRRVATTTGFAAACRFIFSFSASSAKKCFPLGLKCFRLRVAHSSRGAAPSGLPSPSSLTVGDDDRAAGKRAARRRMARPERAKPCTSVAMLGSVCPMSFLVR